MRWRAWQAFYLDAVAGFQLIRREADKEHDFILSLGADDQLDPLDFVNDVSWGYERIFEEPFCTSGIHRATLAEVRSRNALDGANYVELGNSLVVSMFTYWEEYFRREYVVAKRGLDPTEKDEPVVSAALRKHASFVFWGDLGRIRNDIVHHNAVSSAANAGRCQLIKWFPQGASIALHPQQVRTILLALLQFHNDVYAEALPGPPPIIVGRRR